ncbi:hypothetical protein HOLleu_28464 [Holothuria leucospilota]|uniref:Uncharacterized protein n=1 Tax=Holothuria leucospilota TaxID=206669 RepID=A0A9Q1BM02_HOLLE|nr:hypothetical protein HOLleu_28464 [Holothuria leucospilota]
MKMRVTTCVYFFVLLFSVSCMSLNQNDNSDFGVMGVKDNDPIIGILIAFAMLVGVAVVAILKELIKDFSGFLGSLLVNHWKKTGYNFCNDKFRIS